MFSFRDHDELYHGGKATFSLRLPQVGRTIDDSAKEVVVDFRFEAFADASTATSIVEYHLIYTIQIVIHLVIGDFLLPL